MASVINDPNGRRRIQFKGIDDRRRTIRLGKMSRKDADSICRQVEAILGAKISGQPMPRETAIWIESLGDQLREKLAAVNLIEVAKERDFTKYLQDWLEDKRSAGYAKQSLVAWGQVVRDLIIMFPGRTLESLTHEDGERFRQWLIDRKLRATTIHKRLTHARQFFDDAVRKGLIDSNSWKHIRSRAGDCSERRAYVPAADVIRVIEHCPNVWWKLLVALARFGGLRTPSEPFSLTWADIDWERNRIAVPSPKTSRQGKPHRIIPLFPSIRPYLEAAFEAAEPGSVFVIPENYRKRAMGPNGWRNANLRSTLGKVLRRAGVEPWPRLWHSLRSSCESDLAAKFPLAVVTKWLGNTPSIALRHYVDPTDVAFDSAANWDQIGEKKSGANSDANPAQNQA